MSNIYELKRITERLQSPNIGVKEILELLKKSSEIIEKINHREEINTDHLYAAHSDIGKNLERRKREKGTLSYGSSHEAFGIMQQEMDELSEAVHQKNAENIYKEINDVVVAGIWAMASYRSGGMNW